MSVYTPLPNPWKGIPLVGALIDAIQNFLAGLSGSGASVTVSQTAHGFVVGDVLRYDATSHLYVKAQADSAANAEALGIVSVVTDANTFTLLQLGKITGLSGLVEGSVYFLNPSVAGALTTTNPTTPGQVSKPLLVAISTTAGYFFNYRGEVIATPTAPLMGLDGLDGNQSYLPPLLYATSFPSNPVDGQQIIIVDSLTNPTYQWRFRYNGNSSSSYKWEAIGETRYKVTPSNASSASGNGVWEDKGAIFTFPFAGEWEVEVYGVMGGNSSASSSAYGVGFSSPPTIQCGISWNLGNAATANSGMLTSTASQALHAYFEDGDSTRRNSINTIRVYITPKRVSG